MMTTEMIVAKANEVRRELDGTTEPIKRLIADNDLVFAVWQHRAERDGIATQIIKGQALLAEIVNIGSNTTGPMDGDPHRRRRAGCRIGYGSGQNNIKTHSAPVMYEITEGLLRRLKSPANITIHNEWGNGGRTIAVAEKLRELLDRRKHNRSQGKNCSELH